MKFDYAYRDSNNERHDGQLVAPSRDEAFKILRAQGLRPFFVAPSKGLLNRLQSFGKRGLAIAILSLVSLLLVLYFLASLGLLGDAALKYFVDAEALRVKGILPPLSTSTSSLHLLPNPPLSTSTSSLHLNHPTPTPRHQIYGDPALMEHLAHTDYATVFSNRGDRVLAHFAQPARQDRFVLSLRRDPAARTFAISNLTTLVDEMHRRTACGSKGTWPKAIAKRRASGCETLRVTQDSSTAVHLPLISPPNKTQPPLSTSTSFLFSSCTTREQRELVSIVLWMRSEFSAYLANGNGTPESYLRRLIERQTYEAQVVARVSRELEGETNSDIWEKRNDELRAIGAPTLTMPETP